MNFCGLLQQPFNRVVQRLKFLIANNLAIKKLISVNRTFNLTQKIISLRVWLLMRVCECVCSGDDEVSDEEAGNKVMSVVDDSSSDEWSAMDNVIGLLLVDSIDYCIRKCDISSIELHFIGARHWRIINYSTA